MASTTPMTDAQLDALERRGVAKVGTGPTVMQTLRALWLVYEARQRPVPRTDLSQQYKHAEKEKELKELHIPGRAPSHAGHTSLQDHR